MNKIDQQKYLKEKGWYTYYHPEYWCHEMFSSPSKDPTNWGKSLHDAFQYQSELDKIKNKQKDTIKRLNKEHEMKDEEIQKLIYMNYRCLMLLGYASSLLHEAEPYLNEQQIKWFKESVSNIVYFDKPLEPCP